MNLKNLERYWRVNVLCYKSEDSWFDPRWCHLIFYWHNVLPIALWPWDRLSLYKKWVPGIFPVGKEGRYVRLTTLLPYCAVVMKSENLNFLEPSGPLQICNGTALPFFFYMSALAQDYGEDLFGSCDSRLVRSMICGNGVGECCF